MVDAASTVATNRVAARGFVWPGTAGGMKCRYQTASWAASSVRQLAGYRIDSRWSPLK